MIDLAFFFNGMEWIGSSGALGARFSFDEA